MPPGSAIDRTNAINEAIASIQKGINQAIDNFNKLVQAADRFSQYAAIISPGIGIWVMWYISKHMKEIRAALEKLIKVVQTAILNSTPVLSLIHHSFAWLSDVRVPASTIAHAVERDAKLDLTQWEGPAASVYHRIAGEQKEAIGEVVDKAEFISAWLYKIVEGNVDFATKLLETVTKVVGSLVQAAIDAETVIDIPWAIDKAAGMVGDLVEAGLNALLEIAKRVVGSIGSYRDLVSAVGDNTKLGPAGWPEAVKG